MSLTIDTILKENEKKFGQRGFLYEKENGVYQEHTYQSFCEDVRRYSHYLRDHEFGSRIALYAANSYQYMVLDTAIMAYVGICMTLSKEWTYEDVSRMLENGGADSLIYDKERAPIAQQLARRFPHIRFVAMEDLQPQQSYDGTLPEQDRNISCKIIFSSGTTGMPKGVMLSQKNMFASWENLYKRAGMNETDVDYLFLPLYHTYAGICNFLYALISGMKIYLCSDTKKIFEELQEVRPTVFCAVPLIFERLYAVCQEKQLDPAVLLGGNIRYLFCGGAYMQPVLRRYFKSHGLNMMEAYGLSETSSLIATEYSYSWDDDSSCGVVYEHLNVRIADDGEILVKGDNIFNGYYGNEALTAKSFTEDGYFKTGDTGELKNGKLYLIGRKKRMILLSNGENVDPEEIEQRFAGTDHLNKVKVFEKDKQIHAMLYVSAPVDANSLVEKVNATLPSYARISTFEVLNDTISTRLK